MENDPKNLDQREKKNKIKSIFSNAVKFIFNPRFVLCFGIAWIITNGWSYVMLGIGTYFNIKWMVLVSTVYITFLWLPISPEKILTILISILLLRLLFPKDERTLAVLRRLLDKAKLKIRRKKKKENTDNDENQNEKGL